MFHILCMQISEETFSQSNVVQLHWSAQSVTSTSSIIFKMDWNADSELALIAQHQQTKVFQCSGG